MPTEIIHIHSKDRTDIASQVISGLMLPAGQKHLPTMLLYDERGLRLYDDITTQAPAYYLFGAEEQILKDNADEIVRIMHRGEGVIAGEVVLELGAGALRKTSLILLGLSGLVPDARSRAPIDYYALDLERREIERTLGEIASSDIGASLQGKVRINGLCGTYDDGLKFVEEGGLNLGVLLSAFTNQDFGGISPISDYTPSVSESSGTPSTSPPSSPDEVQRPLHVLFLGSSIGNFSREEAVKFLRSLPLRSGSGDTLLLGLDHDNDKNVIEKAYNDPEGYTERFIRNGLSAAGKALGDEALFQDDKWDYVNRYNVVERQHEAFYVAKTTHSVRNPSTKEEILFIERENVKIEHSLKFSETDAVSLFTGSGLRPIQRWTDSTGRYSLWLLERPPFSFPLLKSPTRTYTPFGIPTIQDWEMLWTTWDYITRRMIPPSMLYQKPIDLRHICLFYLGHIPTFLDIHLSRLLDEPHTEPEEYKYIFERGIDPNVDDPTLCHDHSEVPQSDEDWPTSLSILAFQARVRSRLMKLYRDIKDNKVVMTRRVARVLFLTFEHEVEHAETLLYMLLQRAGTGTLPPPGFSPPPWASLAAAWDVSPLPKSETVTLGPADLVLGHDDVEAEDFTNDVDGHEFGWDNESPKRQVHVDKFEISWRPVTNGQFHKFYFGEGKDRVQLPKSWVEVEDEIMVRTLYGPVPMKIAQHWPVMTSYDDLSSYATVKGGRLPTEPELRLFYEKFEAGYGGGANIGFRNWHPVPSTTGERGDGKGHNGGVWEWTSTEFNKYEGFVPSELYPGYSMDFFDGFHQVVIGGSFATLPRIVERKTFRNWYQRNYPYAWVGGRVAYDIRK